MRAWLSSIVKGKEQEAEASPVAARAAAASSSSSSSADVASTEPEQAHGDCASCSDPCHPHTSYPDTFWSKISQDDMHGSVKPHKRHIVVAQHGTSYESWAPEVTDARGSYMRVIDDTLSNLKSQIGYRVRLSACDTPLLTPLADDDERELVADLYVFPDMIVFPSVSRDQLEQWATQLFVEDRGRIALKSQPSSNNSNDSKTTIKLRIEDETYRRPTAPDVSGLPARQNWLPFDLPHEELLGTYFLLCAHKQRDKRCSIAAPILANEITLQHRERVAVYERARDAAEQAGTPFTAARPAHVECMYISHIGGHKFAGNVIAYPGGVWLGRVRPADIHTVLDAFTEVRDPTAQQRLIALHRGYLEW